MIPEPKTPKMIKTFASLFTGCGGSDQGARQAGLRELWGIEMIPGYAAIARLNGFNPIEADINAVDFSKLPRTDWFHCSPPCQNASVANPNAGETSGDLALAATIKNAIKVLEPEYFSLENVPQYKRFEAFNDIYSFLAFSGYSIAVADLDAFRHGVAQSRKRLFMVARRGRKPVYLPRLTHSSGRQLNFLLQPAVGWAEAVSSFELPEYELSDRMLKMVPKSFWALRSWLAGISTQGAGVAGSQSDCHMNPLQRS